MADRLFGLNSTSLVSPRCRCLVHPMCSGCLAPIRCLGCPVQSRCAGGLVLFRCAGCLVLPRYVGCLVPLRCLGCLVLLRCAGCLVHTRCDGCLALPRCAGCLVLLRYVGCLVSFSCLRFPISPDVSNVLYFQVCWKPGTPRCLGFQVRMVNAWYHPGVLGGFLTPCVFDVWYPQVLGCLASPRCVACLVLSGVLKS